MTPGAGTTGRRSQLVPGHDVLDLLKRELPIVKLSVEPGKHGPDISQPPARVARLRKHIEDLAEQAPQLGTLAHQQRRRPGARPAAPAGTPPTRRCAPQNDPRP